MLDQDSNLYLTNLNILITKRKMLFVLLQAWDKEKILIPHEETNLRPSDSALRCSTTEPQKLYGERGLLRSSYDTYSIHKHDAIDIDDPSSM